MTRNRKLGVAAAAIVLALNALALGTQRLEATEEVCGYGCNGPAQCRTTCLVCGPNPFAWPWAGTCMNP